GTPAAALAKGVIRAMLLTKVKLAVAAAFVLALGAGGVAFRVGPAPASAQAPKARASELEALRKENELLRLNLNVVLEKVRAQEAELRVVDKRLRGRVRVPPAQEAAAGVTSALDKALLELKRARDEESRAKALHALEEAVKALRQQSPRK